MDSIRNNEIENSNIKATTHGNPQIRTGKIMNAVFLDGRKDYIEAGDHSQTCLGDLKQCEFGVTISLWLKFGKLEDNMYFLSTGSQGLELYYKNNELIVEAQEGNKNWRASMRGVDTGAWYFIEFTWEKKEGLKMFVNLEKVADVKSYTVRSPKSGNGGLLFIGRANTNMRVERYPNVAVDQVSICFGRRDHLIDMGFLQRGTHL